MYDAKRVYVIGRAPDDHADVIVEANEYGRFRAAGFVVIGNA